ncbi:acyl-CoA dehydrogenase family protein [Streptomyces sp. NPDC057638]|uniref:acyl-CoA dehydrogenase family protein n=1 Tax=Streptomyces sp. NPDC057638 TaxID=3346190 RepID=UPI0036C5EE61
MNAASRTVATAVADVVAGALDRAGEWDHHGVLPPEVPAALAASGILRVDVPVRFGGLGLGPATLGELCARIGGACSALRGWVTVQSMVTAAVVRWGTDTQRARWLPGLLDGTRQAGFAATEEGAGTDLAAVRTRIRADGDEVRVTGRKLWVTFGGTAGLLLVLGTAAGRPTAVLVESDRPGIGREPVTGQLGMRAAALAHVEFDDVRVPRENVIAPYGFGLSHVAATALDHGRFTVAWGCVGMARRSLDLATAHVVRRDRGATPLAAHQLVRAGLARMAVRTQAATELCLRAARLRAAKDPEAVAATIMAKYAAAAAASEVGGRAVQLLGAAGCAPGSAAGRMFRDAKVMEIIEGSEHIAELHIAERLLRGQGFRSAPAAPDRPPAAPDGVPTVPDGAPRDPAPRPSRAWEESIR